MKARTGRLFIPLVLTLAVAGVCHAEDVPLSRILPQFFADGITLAPIAGHEAHFVDQGEALEAMGQLNSVIAGQFATYPLGTSSGAFTFALDEETGAFVPSSDSFGPIFAERPETLGRRKVNVGVTSLFYDFESFEGLEFDRGEVVFTLTHQDTNGDGNSLQPPFEGDLIDSRLFLSLKLNTNILFANFGVTDRLDLGVAIPYVRAEMDAVLRSTVLPVASGGGTHEYRNGSLVRDDRRGGTASGLGDVVLRGKYNFRRGFATGLDLRFPTGDEEDLLGSGATQAKLLFIARGARYDVFYGGLHPHLNVGYTYSSGGYALSFQGSGVDDLEVEPSDEINYAAGFDTAVGPRVTLSVDLVGRVLLDSPTVSVRDRKMLYTALNGQVESITRPELVTAEGDLSLLLATAGLKFHLGKGLLLTVSGLAPILKDRGLESDFVGSFGLDYTF